MKEKTAFAVQSKIWIEDMEGTVVFGLGRYRMLDMIGRLGSMQTEMNLGVKWSKSQAGVPRPIFCAM